MSRFRDNNISQKGFAHLPSIGDLVEEVVQPRGSLDSGTLSSRVSGISSRRGAKLLEGDLITGTVNVVHDRAYMLPAIRDPNRATEKEEVVRVCLHLGWHPKLTHSPSQGELYQKPEHLTAGLPG